MNLPLSFEGLRATQSYYPQDEVQCHDFNPYYDIAGSPDFSHPQEYPVPPSVSVSSYLEQSSRSSSVAESRRGSVSSLPDKRKRKRSTTERTTAKSMGRGSNRKNKPQATDEERPQESKTCRIQYTNANSSASPEQVEDQYSRQVQERNRVASNKFRVKKREDARRLIADEEDMERINSNLSRRVADLTLEVHHLKMKLLQHTDCDCSLIQEYIANEAHRYIKELGDEHYPHHCGH
ncbi:hypothetical protein NW767_015547 [Fusarium falciforme]|nr:hypothetical protein NW767_015547 [Fusarium falciforme]